MTISMTEFKNKRQSKHTNKNQTFIAAAVFHILFSTMIYVIGTSELFPSMFDTRGIGEFASDGVQHMRKITSLVEVIRDYEVHTFVVSTSGFHIKLYAVSFSLLEPLFGFTILSAEIINLMCYLAILWLVYAIGKALFNSKVALYSMWLIGLWPSFVLYTTQLYKTPLFIVALLLLIFVFTRLLRVRQPKYTFFVQFGLGIFALTILWLIRNEWWLLIVGLVTLGTIISMISFRQIPIGNLIVSVLLLLSVIGYQLYAAEILAQIRLSLPSSPKLIVATYIFPRERSPEVGNRFRTHSGVSKKETPTPEPSGNLLQDEDGFVDNEKLDAPQFFVELREGIVSILNSISYGIGLQRDGFSEIKQAGSRIDQKYVITTLEDLLRYQPRALTIGLFAPFPSMWFTSGAKLGLSARLLSGLETLFIYAIFPFSILGVWHTRRDLSAWYLVAVVLVSVMALGTIVVNIGALYRFRYAFWMIVIIFGVGGYNLVALPYARAILDKRRQKSPKI